jgi:hypothetical protein
MVREGKRLLTLILSSSEEERKRNLGLWQC